MYLDTGKLVKASFQAQFSRNQPDRNLASCTQSLGNTKHPFTFSPQALIYWPAFIIIKAFITLCKAKNCEVVTFHLLPGTAVEPVLIPACTITYLPVWGHHLRSFLPGHTRCSRNNNFFLLQKYGLTKWKKTNQLLIWARQTNSSLQIALFKHFKKLFCLCFHHSKWISQHLNCSTKSSTLDLN